MMKGGFPRLSKCWMPTARYAGTDICTEDGHAKLIRGGFIRGSQSGIFHMLPLGLRVQEKIERLIAMHMEDKLGASRVSMPTLSSVELWKKSGRFTGSSHPLQETNQPEFFSVWDRNRKHSLLAPTHEEEVTWLVQNMALPYRDYPVRLYQINRKFRDEARPRNGLLRTREFTMKDLYTFDLSVDAAKATYEQVREVYSDIFKRLRLPVCAVEASSGEMGGDLSHEYHLPSALGEDELFGCDSCDYAAKNELAKTTVLESSAGSELVCWSGITRDRRTLVVAYLPETTVDKLEQPRTHTKADLNIHALQSVVPDIDTSIQEPDLFWRESLARFMAEGSCSVRLLTVFDRRVTPAARAAVGDPPIWHREVESLERLVDMRRDVAGADINLMRVRDGDPCPKCATGALKMRKALELGHVFHLGSRYSKPLGAIVGLSHDVARKLGAEVVKTAAAKKDARSAQAYAALQMGCHGIGVSRVMGALAEHFVTKRGLNWPVAVAPYTCVIVPHLSAQDNDVLLVYNALVQSRLLHYHSQGVLDLVVDDRPSSLPARLVDADLIGIPIIIVMGRDWLAEKKVEVQCHQLGMVKSVSLQELVILVAELLGNL